MLPICPNKRLTDVDKPLTSAKICLYANKLPIDADKPLTGGKNQLPELKIW